MKDKWLFEFRKWFIESFGNQKLHEFREDVKKGFRAGWRAAIKASKET